MLGDVGMAIGMVADGVAFAILARQHRWKLFGVQSDDKKCCGYIFLFQDVQNSRCVRTWTIVKSNRYLLLVGSPARLHHIVGREFLVLLKEIALFVFPNIATALVRIIADPHNLSPALLLHGFLSSQRKELHGTEIVSRPGVRLEDRPQARVFAAQPPQGHSTETIVGNILHLI